MPLSNDNIYLTGKKVRGTKLTLRNLNLCQLTFAVDKSLQLFAKRKCRGNNAANIYPDKLLSSKNWVVFINFVPTNTYPQNQKNILWA